MKPIRLVACTPPACLPLEPLASALTQELRTPCRIANEPLDPTFAHHPERNQYHSTQLLDRLAPSANGEIVLGITAADLYIPILTFVFGEAHVGGPCAVVSYHRLTQEFYGLPRDPAIVQDRLIKEAVHEIGHAAGLTHCDDYECVMASSHAVEWIDLKGRSFCASCYSSYSSEP